MYIVAHHQIKNPEAAFQRGQQLISGDGAPEGVKVLQFYPSQDLTEVTCLWSENHCYAVAAEQAFAERPLGLAAAPALTA